MEKYQNHFSKCVQQILFNKDKELRETLETLEQTSKMIVKQGNNLQADHQKLNEASQRLERQVRKSQKLVSNSLQEDCETMDRDLRILEQTVNLID
ncbi:Hypothetical protein PP7435_CHR1-1928 [Komagataella phaffii CBS 7435]|uniref:Uncharacterized protein n=1 Tax=Komagataella phaffii (strain ATCC 76273 / CBS 7435 / CECT 11047 / NRRL Y-11430 / Wegner 21-1) TaxID=981350 RepID=A0A1G4KP57_KOMPC|nr:Hypothetical protein BQ9382_C1-1542 [Komagataella phaffii CBS 7435]SCV11784.1 Hypothetical protein PP7435_CHR1-1928 [Komagataella phaffii CBS 7435]